jgi:hypothetical protein
MTKTRVRTELILVVEVVQVWCKLAQMALIVWRYFGTNVLQLTRKQLNKKRFNAESDRTQIAGGDQNEKTSFCIETSL